MVPAEFVVMTHSLPHTAALVCHPGTSCQAVHGIEAHVWWTQSAALALTYIFTGDLARLEIPPPGPPRRADRLWQHTCFEAFISVKGQPAYYEFNFTPSGEWAAYAFRRYREGAPLGDDKFTPVITVRSAKGSLDLDVVINLDRLLKMSPRLQLRCGISAVVEEKGGMLSYWAVKHPPGKPDFHHPDAFALELEAPKTRATSKSLKGDWRKK